MTEDDAIAIPKPGLLDALLDTETSLGRSYAAYRREVFQAGAVPAEWRELIVAAIDLALCNPHGALLHLRAAGSSGATVEQIRQTLQLVMFVAGPTVLAQADPSVVADVRALLADPDE